VSTAAARRRRRLRAARIRGLVAAAALGALVGAIVTLAAGGAEKRTVVAHRGHDITFAPAPRAAPRPAGRPDADAAAIQRVRMLTPWIISGGKRKRLVALTFDDGPGPYTVRVLDQLRRLHVPATFFEIGSMVRAFPAVARLVRQRGYPIGDHTESHPFLARLPQRFQGQEITTGAKMIDKATGEYPDMFRPPYGSFNESTIRELTHRKMLMVLWDVVPSDFARPGAQVIVNRVLSAVKPGSIILLHDGGGDRSQTIAALPAIVRGLKKRGFTFVTIPRLMRESPPTERRPKLGSRGVG
jgi:peptidoglycan-N-acetylglucosamine deacetylase